MGPSSREIDDYNQLIVDFEEIKAAYDEGNKLNWFSPPACIKEIQKLVSLEELRQKQEVSLEVLKSLGAYISNSKNKKSPLYKAILKKLKNEPLFREFLIIGIFQISEDVNIKALLSRLRVTGADVNVATASTFLAAIAASHGLAVVPFAVLFVLNVYDAVKIYAKKDNMGRRYLFPGEINSESEADTQLMRLFALDDVEDLDGMLDGVNNFCRGKYFSSNESSALVQGIGTYRRGSGNDSVESISKRVLNYLKDTKNHHKRLFKIFHKELVKRNVEKFLRDLYGDDSSAVKKKLDAIKDQYNRDLKNDKHNNRFFVSQSNSSKKIIRDIEALEKIVGDIETLNLKRPDEVNATADERTTERIYHGIGLVSLDSLVVELKRQPDTLKSLISEFKKKQGGMVGDLANDILTYVINPNNRGKRLFCAIIETACKSNLVASQDDDLNDVHSPSSNL